MKYEFAVQFYYFNIALTCHIKTDPLLVVFHLCGAHDCSCSERMWIRSKVDDERSQLVLVFVFV